MVDLLGSVWGSHRCRAAFRKPATSVLPCEVRVSLLAPKLTLSGKCYSSSLEQCCEHTYTLSKPYCCTWNQSEHPSLVCSASNCPSSGFTRAGLWRSLSQEWLWFLWFLTAAVKVTSVKIGLAQCCLVQEIYGLSHVSSIQQDSHSVFPCRGPDGCMPSSFNRSFSSTRTRLTAS